MSALELRGVWKTRGAGRHAVQALSDVSLALEPGEVALIEGPSGSGKTTLLAVAAGLLTLDRGEAWLAGEPIHGLAPDARRRLRARRVGFVFQRSNLLAGLTARENVRLAALLSGMSHAEAASETEALLGALGAAALADRRPGELSGGEEQRVTVARALVHRPAVVLADEPTANLDWAAGRPVAEALRSIARARGAAVVIATHDPRLEPYADRRIRIADGRVQ